MALDVYEEEAGIFFHDISAKILTDDVLARLMTFNNVVITSHQAFLTEEALTGIAETTIANICEFEQGRRGALRQRQHPADQLGLYLATGTPRPAQGNRDRDFER